MTTANPLCFEQAWSVSIKVLLHCNRVLLRHGYKADLDDELLNFSLPDSMSVCMKSLPVYATGQHWSCARMMMTHTHICPTWM